MKKNDKRYERLSESLIERVYDTSKLKVRFYYDKQLFVSVLIPFGRYYRVYMNCGTDNRPYNDIINDIKAALELLIRETPHGFTYDTHIAMELPYLLGYRPSNADLI